MKKSFVILLLTILNVFQQFSFAQNRNLDSIRLCLKNINQDTNRLRNLNLLASEMKNIKPDTAILLATQALFLSQKLLLSSKIEISNHAKKHQANAQQLLGTCNMIQGAFEVALEHTLIAIELWDELSKCDDARLAKNGKIGKARCYGTMANIYNGQTNYPKALTFYLKGLKLSEELGQKQAVANIYANVASLYSNQTEYQKALQYYFKALKINQETKSRDTEAYVLGNIGTVYQSLRNYKLAIEYYAKSLAISEELGLKQSVAYNLDNIGNVYEELGEYENALDYLFKALKLSDELQIKPLIAHLNSNIGSVYIYTKNYKESEKYLNKAITISREIGDMDAACSIELIFSQLYDSSNVPKLALEHFKKHIELKDTIYSEENSRQLVRSEMNYEFEKKEAVMKETQEKERAIAEEKNRFQKIVITAVAGGLFLVIIFAFIVFRTLKQTRLQKYIIEEKQKEILDSIYYARKIQRALITNEKYINKSLSRLQKN